MINKIVAIQGNHPSKLKPISDTTIFIANEIQNKKYRIFYYEPKDLSIVNSNVIASGFFIKFDYKNLDKTEKQILKKIFQEGYKTIMNDKKLSVKSHAELSDIFVKGDNAKAKAWSIKSIDKLISN